ncbi:hypothetical protein I3843_03G179300 [Carya illinoinensis]|uniref:Uncharacterized protein n=1 Tax=Carya illinoinensis TaxID=32201 RepID=A0A8T1R2W8_CARIL|nr:hypothetical protein I3760_03G178100 [Carya illinoinensis]KAG6661598.1 hypothetical protein CIPAW_03G185300 [Carya illinoinensis]KAG6722769.1 hypothetical protein I3842_03G177100 [Carya illinoinensis]KAG7988268.1 hypothetical protein I3843_03G179300 [Carya illinoinensis]
MAANLNSLVRGLLLVVMLILNIAKSSESRVPHDTFLERENVTKALRSLFENTKKLEVGFGEEGIDVGSPYDSKRRSPGGPDPYHHSKNG